MRDECLDMLEKLIKLPKEISAYDLAYLKGLKEVIRRQWWDELSRIEDEYHMNYLTKPECEKSERFEGYIHMSKLKLFLSFRENNEAEPPFRINERVIQLLKDLEDNLPLIRRLSEKELAEYYRNKLSGFIGLLYDSVEKGIDPLDEIIKNANIPDSLAKAFKWLYQNDIEKMKEAMKILIDTPISVKREIEELIEKSMNERTEVEKNILNLEERLNNLYDLILKSEKEKAELEKRILELEKSSLDSTEFSKFLEREEAIKAEFEKALEEQRKIIENIQNEIKRLEGLRDKLSREILRVTAEERERIEKEMERVDEIHNKLKDEIEKLKKDYRELSKSKDEIRAIIESFSDEDIKIEGVTKEEARLMEVDYAKNVENRLKELGKWRKIEVLDEREKIYQELKKLDPGISYESLNSIPNNLIIRAVKGFWNPEEFEVRILSHYKELYLNGFDVRKFSQKELLDYVDISGKKVLALASTTGWSDKAVEYAIDTPLKLILVDLKEKKLYYNNLNLDLKNYLYYLGMV